MQVEVVALTASDFVLLLLLAFVVLWILPCKLLALYRRALGAAARRQAARQQQQGAAAHKEE